MSLLLILLLWWFIRPADGRWIADHPDDVHYRHALRNNIHLISEEIANEESYLCDLQLRLALWDSIDKHRTYCN
jgi:hypothetical protein